MTRYDDIMAKVTHDGDCILWAGYVRPDGYGEVSWENKIWLAHRWFYTMLVGPISDTLDHVKARGCKHKHCVNTEHLEEVTRGENTLRAYQDQTHCKHGHEYTEETTHIHPSTGRRGCLICRRESSARWNAKVSEQRRTNS